MYVDYRFKNEEGIKSFINGVAFKWNGIRYIEINGYGIYVLCNNYMNTCSITIYEKCVSGYLEEIHTITCGCIYDEMRKPVIIIKEIL